MATFTFGGPTIKRHPYRRSTRVCGLSPRRPHSTNHPTLQHYFGRTDPSLITPGFNSASCSILLTRKEFALFDEYFGQGDSEAANRLCDIAAQWSLEGTRLNQPGALGHSCRSRHFLGVCEPKPAHAMCDRLYFCWMLQQPALWPTAPMAVPLSGYPRGPNAI